MHLKRMDDRFRDVYSLHQSHNVKHGPRNIEASSHNVPGMV